MIPAANDSTTPELRAAQLDHIAPADCATRRNVLATRAGGAALTALAVSTMPADAAEHADAELLTLCTDFEATARRFNGLWRWRVSGTDQDLQGPNYIHDDDERDEAAAPFNARMASLSDAIAEHPPTTLDGFRAVARCILLSAGEVRDAARGETDLDSLGFSYEEWQLAIGLLHGLTGGNLSDRTCFDAPGVLVECEA